MEVKCRSKERTVSSSRGQISFCVSCPGEKFKTMDRSFDDGTIEPGEMRKS